MQALVVFVVAFLLRCILLFTVYGDLRHGSATVYGSTALGVWHDQGLTHHLSEETGIQQVPDNITGDYGIYYQPDGRETMTEFLPGPAVLLGWLWKMLPVHNFAPYLIFQVFLDSLLTAVCLLVLVPVHRGIGYLTALFMVVNLPAIKRTLMMGYDFWPQYGTLLLFLGAIWIIRTRRGAIWYGGLGLSLAVVPWFREITTFLPFVVIPFLGAAVFRGGDRSVRSVSLKLGALAIPLALSVIMLSAYRHHTTGNWRPTRSTFWHTFFAGVGQFDNPYGLESKDASVWAFGQRLDPELRHHTLGEMYQLPDSPYERVLAREARRFVSEHPLTFIRNTLYRAGIILSPLLYRHGDYLPARLAARLAPLGILMLVIWVVGMYWLYRRQRILFLTATGIYSYFVLAFSWFYVAGRVILPLLFLDVVVYLAGLEALAQRFISRGASARGLR